MPENPQPVRPLPSSLQGVGAGRHEVFSVAGIGSGRALLLMALGGCWLLFFNELLGEWQVNPQYSFGYVVPLLGLALLWKRWPDRPTAAPGTSSSLSFLVLCLFLLQLPMTLVLEA